MNDVFLADTYALIAIITGEKSYEQFKNAVLLTHQGAILETYYYIVRIYNQKTADFYLDNPFAVPIGLTKETIRQSMMFKHKYRSEKLSYVDCVGYTLAMEKGVPFLTGDKQFKDKENVFFIQAENA